METRLAEVDRMMNRYNRRRGWALVWMIGAVLGGCGPIERPVPVDEEGEEVAVPAPGESWLELLEQRPVGETSVRPVVELVFDQYLDRNTFTSYGAISVSSGGGLTQFGETSYWMTRKTLRFTPRSDLEAGLVYQINLSGGEGLRSVVGSPLIPGTVLGEFRTSAEVEGEGSSLARRVVERGEIERILEAKCQGCHGDQRWGLPEMEVGSLWRTRSEQVDLFLVEPYAPERSYLMHKILPDYPERRFTVQPPPWSEVGPLSLEEVELIEHWIASGAQ